MYFEGVGGNHSGQKEGICVVSSIWSQRGLKSGKQGINKCQS